MASTPDLVRIRYRRPPDREELFVQRVIARTRECVVTFLAHTPLRQPLEVSGSVILEPGASAIWFTFPHREHDIGRFHLQDGTFTGIYANVLTPVEGVDGNEWITTDLFLDVWQAVGRGAVLLDEEELDEAVRQSWVDEPVAAGARAEARRLLHGAAAGTWPPAIVHEWTLERVHARLEGRA